VLLGLLNQPLDGCWSLDFHIIGAWQLAFVRQGRVDQGSSDADQEKKNDRMEARTRYRSCASLYMYRRPGLASSGTRAAP